MKLVDVEFTFDNSKIVFYFTADGRVDFRELVKDLAGIFKTRIELRQIGVRDEAKMLGGLGPCGRPCCCSSFLGDFNPVSIKMAKEQNLSLSPTKISGLCGRLMCCLNYEQAHYGETRRRMPRPGSTVDTPDGKGVVLDNNGSYRNGSRKDHAARRKRRYQNVRALPTSDTFPGTSMTNRTTERLWMKRSSRCSTTKRAPAFLNMESGFIKSTYL